MQEIITHVKVSHEAAEDDGRDKNEAMTVYIDQHEVTKFSHEVAATTTFDQAVASTTAAGAKKLVVMAKSTSDTGRCSACGW